MDGLLKTRGDRLRWARKNAGFKSATAAAKSLGVPRATYNAHERAEDKAGRDYDPEDAARYGRRFNKVRPEWLLTGRGDPKASGEHIDSAHVLPADASPEERGVEIVGYVGAGGQAHRYAVGQGSLDRAARPADATDQTVAVEIRGASLGKQFDRWLVYYDDVRSPVTSDLIGQLCVVGLADDRILIKAVQRGKNGLFNLISNNPEEPPIKNVVIEWAALVNDIRRKR